MSLKNQLSFSSGELDPILHDRVTLERFQNGLHTGRNGMISETGSLLSRFGRYHFVKAKFDDKPIRVFSPPNSSIFLEIGEEVIEGSAFPLIYIRVYGFNGALLHEYLEFIVVRPQDIKNLHIFSSGEETYFFRGVKDQPYDGAFKIRHQPPYTYTQATDLFKIPTMPFTVGWSYTVLATGYAIDYAVTKVVNGEETEPYIWQNINFKKPIATTEYAYLTIEVDDNPANLDLINEVRFYQRPKDGSGFGYIGKTTNIYVDAGKIKAKFSDIGMNADFTNGPPIPIANERLSDQVNLGFLRMGTGTVYQQRLLIGNFLDFNKEAILASRPGFKNNFYRDAPISADSALNFKSGTTGNAEVLRMIDSDGLVVFTTAGVYVSVGALSPTNIALQRRGSWVIDESIPPLVIPGGLFFVDKVTSKVRQLIYSQEIGTYIAADQSIFSDHLFKKRTIKSWSFQDGTAPLLIVNFSDGTFATLTYNYEQQMKAWMRHDSIYPVEQVEGTGIEDTSIFVTNKNGTRYIEFTIPRTISSTQYASNPEVEITAFCAYMDALKVKTNLINNYLHDDILILAPVVPDDWSGNLKLTCGTSEIFLAGTFGELGNVYRHFNPKDKTRTDLEVIQWINDNEIIVKPSLEFPEEYAVGCRLYLTHTIVEGLEHLEGEEVSVISDGDVMSSPYNDNQQDNMNVLTVIGGEIEYSNNHRSAISIVGRPIVGDIKTLNISTVEQSPTTLESLTVNKLYVRVFETNGLFVGNQFPENKDEEVDGTSVKEMESLDRNFTPNTHMITGNRSKPKTSKRIEVTIPGSWENNGEMALRQVDPLHFEILSIIADVEILRRSDR